MPAASSGNSDSFASGVRAPALDVATSRTRYDPWLPGQVMPVSALPDGSVLLDLGCLGPKNYWLRHFGTLACASIPPLRVPVGSDLETLIAGAQHPTGQQGQPGARKVTVDSGQGVPVEGLLQALGTPLVWCSFDEGYAEAVIALYAPHDGVSFVVFDDGGGGICLSYIAPAADATDALRWFVAHLPESAFLALSASALGVALDAEGIDSRRRSVCALAALEGSLDPVSGECFTTVQDLSVGQTATRPDGGGFPVMQACARITPAEFLSSLDARSTALVAQCSISGSARSAWLAWCVASQLDGGEETVRFRDVGADACVVDTILSLAHEWTGSLDDLVRASRLLCEAP